jgi:GntR family transcriptional regulator
MHDRSAQPPSAIDFSQSGVSRYVQLATLFQRRIETGQWPLGRQIPTVDQLAAECSVARATVRQALDILEEQKLIARYRAKGTFVIKQPQDRLWCEVATDWSGLLMSREGLVIEILSIETATQPKNLLHKIGKLAPVYRHLRRRHWRGDAPYYLGDLYIDERVCRRIRPTAFESKSAMMIIKEVPGLQIAEARQTLTIGTADLEIAELLRLPLNAPVAFVHRSVVDSKGDLALVTDGIYRGDVVRLDIKLK